MKNDNYNLETSLSSEKSKTEDQERLDDVNGEIMFARSHLKHYKTSHTQAGDTWLVSLGVGAYVGTIAGMAIDSLTDSGITAYTAVAGAVLLGIMGMPHLYRRGNEVSEEQQTLTDLVEERRQLLE